LTFAPTKTHRGASVHRLTATSNQKSGALELTAIRQFRGAHHHTKPTGIWRCGEKSRNNAAATWLVACGAWVRVVVVSAVGNLTFLLPLPCRTRHPAGFFAL
jgi:hypothetical protein